MQSVQRYLVTTSFFLVALILAAGILFVWELQRVGRRQAGQQLLTTTRALSLVVDGELKRYEAVLRVLSTSQHIARRDWAGLDRQARTIVAGPNAWLVLSDRSGRQLVNTGLPAGAKLPSGNAPSDMWRDLDQGRSRICNLARGRIEPNILCVDVAVPSGSRPELALSIVMRPAELTNIMRRQRIDTGTYANVVDRRGIIVWRNVRPELFIGQPATQDIRLAMAARAEGVQNSHSLEGTPTIAAFSRSSYSGWTFVVGVPRSAFGAGGNYILPLAIGGAALLLLVGSGVGLMAARRVTRAAKTLAATAESIERGLDPTHRPTGLREIDAAGEALQSAFQARKFTEDRFRRIFEQTSDLVITADLRQVITDCNESAAAAVGVPRHEAIGRHIAEFISSDDYARTTGMLQQKLAAGGTTRYDIRVRNSRGEWLFWEINSGLMHGPDGQALGLHVVGRDVTERKRAEERQQLLINELNHRVKNTLAIVQALAQQSFKGVRSPDDERASFAARLATLAAAHNLLTRQSWEAVSLAEVIETAVGAVCGEEARRHNAEGPPVTLEPQTAVSMAMAFHELCTNTVKYGALSTGAGTVVTRWEVDSAGSAPALKLEWIEQGGPRVEPPTRKGFGTRMIERALASELRASVELDFRPEGLVCRLVAPLPRTSA